MVVRHSPIVGVFNDSVGAERAIEALYNSGFTSDQISYSGKPAKGGFFETIKHLFSGTEQESTADIFENDLTGMGLSQDEAHYYAREYQAGHPIVAVSSDGREREAETVLRDNGGYGYGMDIGGGAQRPGVAGPAGIPQPQGEATRSPTDTGAAGPAGIPHQDVQQGYAARGPSDIGVAGPAVGGVDIAQQTAPFRQAGDVPTSSTQSPGGAGTMGGPETEAEQKLKLRSEQLNVEKERVQTGEVRLHKEIVTEQKSINVPVSHEEIVVEHHPVTEGETSETPIGQGQDEVVRIPVTEEQIHVTKTPIVTGEATIGKREVEETRQVTDTVRHEEPRLEQEGNPNIRGEDDLEQR